VLRSISLAFAVAVLAPAMGSAHVAALGATPPTVAPSCEPDQPAHEIRAVDPDYPDDVAKAPDKVDVTVKVSLDADGRLLDALVAKSSGLKAFDDAALKAARRSTYAPARLGCSSVASSAIIDVVFRACDTSDDPSVAVPVLPKIPAGSKVSQPVSAIVHIEIDATGTVISAVIAQSTGDPALDREAIATAKATKFHPQTCDGKPELTDTGYEIEFDPPTPSPSPLPSHQP